MKKVLAIISVILLITALFAGCKKEEIEPVIIALPGDAVANERALSFLEKEKIIKRDGNGEIIRKPENTEFSNVNRNGFDVAVKQADFVVMDSDTAAANGIYDPPLINSQRTDEMKNVMAVRAGTESSDMTKVLVAVMQSSEIKNFINEKFSGNINSLIIKPGDGEAGDVNYNVLAGQKIEIACSGGASRDIAEKAKEILAEKNIELVVSVFETPDDALFSENEELPDAYYFPETVFTGKDDFITVTEIHSDMMGLYAGTNNDINILKDQENK